MYRMSNQYQLVLPIMRKRLPSYQYHATELPIINVRRCSCQICDHIRIQPLMYIPHKFMPNSPFITCKPPLIIYIYIYIYIYRYIYIYIYIFNLIMTSYNNPINYTPNILKREESQLNRTLSPSLSLRQRSLAQARRSLAQASSPRLDEGSKD